MIPELSLSSWVLVCCAAFLIGVAKNGVPGIGVLIVPLMAMSMPARASVGALLPMLIIGDITAIAVFRRHAQWDKIWRLFGWVGLGVLAGVALLARISNAALEPLLGIIVLTMLLLELLRKKYVWDQLPEHKAFGAGTGVAAGFATSVGNAAGPIMSMYLISRKLPKLQFIGTAAWFFFLVNSSKVPFYIAMDIITVESLILNALMIPVIVFGAFSGRRLLPYISQRLFNGMVLALAAVASLKLIFF